MNQKRIRDYGIMIGSLPTGERNSITDIDGVTVGHCTIDTPRHKTGVTVILPCPENIFANNRIAASYVLNGFGKSAGLIQIEELGTLESPIALTNTLNVGLVSDALVTYTVERCASDGTPLFSYNPVVGECNDHLLNDIKKRAVREEHVLSAIASASKNFAQGDVGAGKGTICYGLKGGIGSSSRKMTIQGSDYHIGVLVQSNFGRADDLMIGGYPAGKAIAEQIKKRDAQNAPISARKKLSMEDKGSIISVVATDLPLSHRQLGRILRRAVMGLGRTGSYVGNGSGDIMIGFSTACPITAAGQEACRCLPIVHEDFMDIPFRAVIEAEEEAILNSLAAADTVTGYRGDVIYGIGEFWNDLNIPCK